MYGLFLNGFEVSARLGVHAFEKAAPQRVVIHVALAVEDAPDGDDFAAVLDYDFLREEIAGLIGRGHIVLQETLCAAVLALCRARPGVLAARVSTEKPDVYPDTRAVGCRMVWIGDGVDRLDALLALGPG